MDYAERGALEKTFDELIENESAGLSGPNTERNDILLDETKNGLSEAGQLYLEGILIGILATMRTFLDEPADLTIDDAEEIKQIIARREPELTGQLAE